MNTQFKTKQRIVKAYQFTKENQLKGIENWPKWIKKAFRKPTYSDNIIDGAYVPPKMIILFNS